MVHSDTIHIVSDIDSACFALTRVMANMKCFDTLECTNSRDFLALLNVKTALSKLDFVSKVVSKFYGDQMEGVIRFLRSCPPEQRAAVYFPCMDSIAQQAERERGYATILKAGHGPELRHEPPKKRQRTGSADADGITLVIDEDDDDDDETDDEDKPSPVI
jgi:hypothetical protein